MSSRTSLRGDGGAYLRYLAGMDAALLQKTGLAAAFLPGTGVAVDMGCGSAKNSEALARLHPELQVIGLDLDPAIARLALRPDRPENLSIVVADLTGPPLRPRTVDACVNSSVLHHVSSYGGYDFDRVRSTLARQADLLDDHGVLVVRDFVAPETGSVLLELPTTDGDDSDDPRRCSSANLLKLFATQFRSLSKNPGFDLRIEPGADTVGDWTRFRLEHRHATEFVLRKDYRQDWEAEVREEYTVFTQEEYESELRALGLRVLVSTPIWNPWIVRHRFEGRFRLFDLDGTSLPFPPSNYLIVAERVPHRHGVVLREASARAPLGFVELRCYRDEETEQVFDLALRPNPTLDLVPWIARGEAIHVLARRSYPRPVLKSSALTGRSLDGRAHAGYLIEPLNLIQGDLPLAQSIERALTERLGLDRGALLSCDPLGSFLPSPGGVLEEVRAFGLEIADPTTASMPAGVSGFSSSGIAMEIEARQLLRSCQAGGLVDARLEANVYLLLHRLGMDWGPWIASGISPGESGAPFEIDDLPTSTPADRRFRRVRKEESAGFLEVRSAEFEELDERGEVIASRHLDYVVPGVYSCSTVTLLAMRRRRDEVVVAVEPREFPACQVLYGASAMLALPAWRLPPELKNYDDARSWLREQAFRHHGLTVASPAPLGHAYWPSPGLTPEQVFPFASAVETVAGDSTGLLWVPLLRLLDRIDFLHDLHLRLSLLRAAHAMSLRAAPAHAS